LDDEGIRAVGVTTCGGRVGTKPFVCTRGREGAGSARGVEPGTTRGGFWPLARCPAESTGVIGERSCGVFLPESSSPDVLSSGVAAPLSLDIHSSSSSLATVDAAIVKPALGLPPRGGCAVVARRGATAGMCSRDCTRAVLPVRGTFARATVCRKRGQRYSTERSDEKKERKNT
jgi:hypothetical protein